MEAPEPPEPTVLTEPPERPEPIGPARIECLYRRHRRTLQKFARRTLGRREDAEDVVQEAFLKLAREFPRLRADRDAAASTRRRVLPDEARDRQLCAWLARTIARLSLNLLRRSRRRRRRESIFSCEHALPPVSPCEVHEREEVAERLREILNELPERVLRPLGMWLRGEPSGRIAQELHLAPGSVRKALTRARREFRARYRETVPAVATSRPERRAGPGA